MKTYMVVLGVLLLIFADAAQAEVLASSQSDYRNGIEQFDRGELGAASKSFYKAIELTPNPESSPDLYLPYINLSIALFEMGKTRAARDALIQSQVFGVAAKTEEGRQLLDRYAAEIMAADLDGSKLGMSSQHALVASPSPETSNRKVAQQESADVQSEADAVLDDDQVIKRCASSISRADSKLPWFFYYQCGVELMNTGNAQKAIEAFRMGANVLEDPRRGKRMYGMWFVDYLPYYQMALAHSQLEEWESANAAIESSEDHGEFSPADPGYEKYSELDQLIKSKLENSDS